MDGFFAARARAETEDVVWFSSSPMVAEVLQREGEKFRWLDRQLKPGRAWQLGLGALKAASHISGLLKAPCEDIGWPELSVSLEAELHRLISVLLFKSSVLASWWARSARRHVVVGETSLTLQNKGTLGVGFYDTLYAALAERSGREIEILRQAPADMSALKTDIDRLLLSDRILSLLDASPDQLVSRTLRMLPGPVRKGFRQGRPVISILRDNETIREMLPWLLRLGCIPEYCPAQAVPKPGNSIEGLPRAQEIRDILERTSGDAGRDADLDSIADLTAGALRDASCYWRPALKAAGPALDRVFAGATKGTIVSNTVSGIANLALVREAHCRNIPVGVIEHGVSAGISKYHEPLREFSEAARGQYYLTCSFNAEKFFRRDPALARKHIRAVGLPDQTRHIRLRGLQRWLTRRRLGAKSGDRVTVYLARHVQNNFRFLPYTPEDHEVHALQRTMADRVMPALPGVPVIKLYSTRRYRDTDPLAEDFAAPPPVRTLKSGDFRFLRAAADVIILESPLSTLGWAMGAGKPVFYLAHPSLPLLPEAAKAMGDALFWIDLQRENWPEHLLTMLRRSDDDILAEWREKEEARTRFLEEFVFGPKHAGRNAAAACIKFGNLDLPSQSMTRSVLGARDRLN